MFVKNPGPLASPLVKLSKRSWGIWETNFAKETLEILMGAVQELVIPAVEVDTTSDGSPALVFRFARHQGSHDAANEVPHGDVVHEAHEPSHMDQQESEPQVALGEDKDYRPENPTGVLPSD